ncbi:MAG: UDP-N-acetylmuramoyl-tripeptide--D-alanyl-D-alanine ligase [Candidatus Dadabacteria bacterium]
MKLEQLYDIYLQYPSIQTDTRKLKAGDLFFALKGEKFNGNQFASKALESGAAYAIIDQSEFDIPGKTIVVEDVLSTLQEMALYHRKQFSIPFIAITGSNGKTTTKELIHAVLSSSYTTYTTEGNLNNHIGVPLTILKIRDDAQMAVIEMGANHRGEIASYCKIALPTHGLITNCGKAHLEGFGGVEGVRKGKGELFDYLRENDGLAFLINDYDYLLEMSRGIKEIFTYGTHNADIVGNVLQSDPFLDVKFTEGINRVLKTNLVGNYNLPNILAAVAVGKYFKVPEQKMQTAIEGYSPTNSRSQMVEKNSNRIILDAYNANPSSMKAAIENFASLHAGEIAGNDHKILVLGAMAELGPESPDEHKALVDEIKQHNWKEVLLVGGDFLNIEHPFKQFTTAIDAGEWLKQKNIHHSYILVKGSRSMAMEKVMEYI